MKPAQVALIVSALIVTVAVLGVAILSDSANQEAADDRLQVVATFYPVGFLAETIGGENVTVRILIPENQEVHHYDPKPSDIKSIQEADVLIYNGAGVDHWFEDELLALVDTAQKAVVDTTEGLTLLEANHEHGARGEYETRADDHEGHDPHTWVSPHMARQQALNIYQAFIIKDPGNATYYAQRWQALDDKLAGLDAEYTDTLANATKKDIFVSHEAYGYLAHRYNFTQHGAIGLSADEQPSAADLAGLVEEMKTLEIYTVFVDPVYEKSYAETLKQELESQTGENVKILKLYLMLGEIDELDFLGQVEKNLDSLKAGLEVV